MATGATSAILADRLMGAYFGLLIGDALSSPVHWYYNPADIASEFGTIRDFHKPKATHPSSILSLSSTGGAGRGGKEGNIIGDVISHGKKHYWLVPGTHYHATLQAGENTLNAQVARLLARTLAAEGAYSADSFLRAYVDFMTTPGSHNDVYAETCHRMFFKNWAAGKPPAACADDDGHNVASMGGFVLLPPVALFTAVQALRKHMSASAGTSVEVGAAAPVAASGGGSGAAGVATAGASNSISAPCIAASEAPGAVALAATVASPLDSVPLPLDPAPSGVTAAAVDATVAQMYCTHNSKQLEGHARVYAELLVRVLLGADLRTAVADAGAAIGIDVPALHRAHGKGPLTRVVGRMFSPACYIDGSFPSLLYMAYAFADDPEAALIGNTNAGGENCHRGAALGALMGLTKGMASWPRRWIEGLPPADEIQAEARAFAAAALRGSHHPHSGDACATASVAGGCGGATSAGIGTKGTVEIAGEGAGHAGTA